MSKYFGFKDHYGNQMPRSGSIQRGWWERKSGAEGGELIVNVDDKEVIDFDGANDLPDYVKEELKEAGYTIDWENEHE